MNSHELAKVLLGLPDKQLEIVKGEGQYTSEWELVGVPWDFWGGTIRMQIQPAPVYNWESTGPDGCDTHYIKHPCGPCITGKRNPQDG